MNVVFYSFCVVYVLNFTHMNILIEIISETEKEKKKKGRGPQRLQDMRRAPAWRESQTKTILDQDLERSHPMLKKDRNHPHNYADGCRLVNQP